MSSTNLYSHPGKRLQTHLKNVGNFSKKIFNDLEIKNKDLFAQIAFLIGISHDFAKSTSFFQNYLKDSSKTENKNHGFLSAIFTFYVVNSYIKENNIDFPYDLDVMSYLIVLTHHGNLKSRSKLFDDFSKKVETKMVKKQLEDIKNSSVTLEDFYNELNIDFEHFILNFDEIKNELSEKLIFFEMEDDINNYFIIILLYSALIDADKMDASQTIAIERQSINGEIVDNYKENVFKSVEGINIIREEAYKEVISNIETIGLDNKILSINLPTGIGKTLIGVSTVLKLKERIEKELSFNPRFIYSLPFLSIIDQNEEVMKNILEFNNLKGSDILLKHNHLAEFNYENEEEYDINKSKLLIEGWNSEIILTTFVQFFNSIISNKNKSLRKYHNITNSIILLDEIQAIPYKYWDIINSFLKKLAYECNCWIILMTATQPFIFNNDEIVSLVDNPDYYYKKFDRVTYNFMLDEMYLDDFTEVFIEELENSNNDIMVVLNTISSSKEIYSSVKEYYEFLDKDIRINPETGICEIGDNIQLIYLSTNIIPDQRLKRIEAIKNSEKQNIIITTQLIEAGVDIDVDVVYRDLAPLDSIIQSAGRCNRNDKDNKGEVNIINLKNENDKSFSSFVYESTLLEATLEILKTFDKASEKDFNFKTSNDYFQEIAERGNTDKEELFECIEKLNFEDISSKFKLIDDDIKKVDVFIKINQKAIEIFDEFERIKSEFSGFERKNEFLKFKSEFYKYVISVDENKIGSTNIFEDEIFVVNHDELDRKYDIETGFISQTEEDVFII